MATPVIIDSVGFSASQSIAEYLSHGKNAVVVHGTRNFRNPTALGGPEDLGAHEFIAEMEESVQADTVPIAVHCYYPPPLLREIAEQQHFRFLGLMRRDLKKQILSSFSWRLNALLTGRTLIVNQLQQGLQHRSDGLRSIDVEPNIYAHLLLMSVEVVTHYNAQLKSNTSSLVFMEDIVENPLSLAKLCGLSPLESLPLELPSGNSHNNRMASWDFLPDFESLFEKIIHGLKFNSNNGSVGFDQFQKNMTEA